MTEGGLGPYLRCLADRMGLRDWTVGHDEKDPGGDRHASARWVYGRKRLWVRFSPEFHADAAEARRQTAVHELIHAHFAPVDDFLREHLGAKAFSDYRMLSEYGVDALADVIAPHMPLPSEVRAVKKPKGPKCPKGGPKKPGK